VSAEPSPDDQRLLPCRIRRPAAALAAGCAVVFLALAIRYRGASTGGAFDSRVLHWLQAQNDLPFSVVSRLTALVPPVFFLVVIVLAIAALALRQWPSAALTVFGPGLSMLVVEVGKSVVGRTLDGRLAMPSGHTAGVTSVSLIVAILVVDRLRGRVLPAAVLGLAAVSLMAGVIGVLMVLGHFHYATDTIAGYCAAVATTLGVAFAVDAVADPEIRGRRQGMP
jgi:membrane-associated phospholipid phosphatase